MRRGKFLFIVTIVTAVLSGCGSASQDRAFVNTTATTQSASDAYWGAEFSEVEEASLEPQESVSKLQNVQSDRKLIKTVDMNVETKEFDLLMETIEKQVNELGGYIERMDSYNGSVYSNYRVERNADLTIRIPQDVLDTFLHRVSDIGNVTNRSENVEDVTLTYVDIQSKRDTLETEHARLLELLERAESIEDIITIEDRLSNVRYQLQSMEAQLRTYDNRIDYSTVYLYISEVQELTPVEEESVWERIAGGFVQSLKNVGSGLVEFAIWFTVHIPYLAIWAIALFVIFAITKKIMRKRREKKNPEGKEEKKTETTNEQ